MSPEAQMVYARNRRRGLTPKAALGLREHVYYKLMPWDMDPSARALEIFYLPFGEAYAAGLEEYFNSSTSYLSCSISEDLVAETRLRLGMRWAPSSEVENFKLACKEASKCEIREPSGGFT